VDVVEDDEDASNVLLDEEEFEILFDTVVLVAIMIMIYPSGREEKGCYIGFSNIDVLRSISNIIDR
jgi:hypothetical protein